MIDTLMHYPETPSTRQQIARSAFTDGFLYQCCQTTRVHFMVLVDINITGRGTKPLPYGLYQFMSLTEGTALFFEFEWVL